jgi:hypothetical protein
MNLTFTFLEYKYVSRNISKVLNEGKTNTTQKLAMDKHYHDAIYLWIRKGIQNTKSEE